MRTIAMFGLWFALSASGATLPAQSLTAAGASRAIVWPIDSLRTSAVSTEPRAIPRMLGDESWWDRSIRLRYTLGGAAIGAGFVAATLAVSCRSEGCIPEHQLYVVPIGALLGGVVGHLLGAANHHARR